MLLISCSKETIYSGKILNQENFNNINFKNKQNLLNNLGNPSYIDPVSNKFFYYSEKKQKKSIFEKKIDYSFVFVFEFNDDNTIASSKVFDLKQKESIELIKEETSNEIIQRGFLEKIFGGVGPQNELPTTP